MHPRAKKPVLVPVTHWEELEELSKADLMDMIWSLACQLVESEHDILEVVDKIRAEWAIVRLTRQPVQRESTTTEETAS